jgi:hypothetical protein
MAKTKSTNFDYLKGMKFTTEDEKASSEKMNVQVERMPSEPLQVDEPKVKVGYMIPASLVDFIKRCAFWEREDDTAILVQALTEFAKDKHYDPIPPEKMKKKRGAKPKR